MTENKNPHVDLDLFHSDPEKLLVVQGYTTILDYINLIFINKNTGADFIPKIGWDFGCSMLCKYALFLFIFLLTPQKTLVHSTDSRMIGP